MDSSSGQGGREFPSTHWSQVARAADSDPQAKRNALGQLLLRYLPAFRAHLMWRWWLSADEADDLLQSFVCDRVVAEQLIARADRSRGRFRAFLLTALNRHVMQAHRHAMAQKRVGDQHPLELEESAALPAEESAADVFDLAWARQVICQAVVSMRQHCQSAPQQQRVWEVFNCRVLAPIFQHSPPPRYEELAQRYGFASFMQAANALTTGKRMFGRILRSLIAEYAADEGEITAELHELWDIFSRAGPDTRDLDLNDISGLPGAHNSSGDGK